MKTTLLCLLVSAFLLSCQSDASTNASKEDVWKKKTSEGLSPTANNVDATNAPLDGGLSVLLVAGVAYGVKRHRKKA